MRLTYVEQVKTLADEIGVAFLGLGFQPKWSVADTPAMPKARPQIAALPSLTERHST
jgi:glutamate--cysteine ligase